MGEEEHGQLLRQMRQLGYNTGIKTRMPNMVSNLYPKALKKIKTKKRVNNDDESFENLQPKKRIAEFKSN